jgi:hypothetical protein
MTLAASGYCHFEQLPQSFLLRLNLALDKIELGQELLANEMGLRR